MKIGDEVALIDDDLKGKIIKISGDAISFEDSHGFVHQYQKNEILFYSGKIEYKIDITNIPLKSERIIHKSKKQETRHYKIDMHWEKISKVLEKKIKTNETWERYFLMKIYLKSELENAKQKNFKKVEVIHGIGDGILQKEIIRWVKEMSDIEIEESEFFKEITGSLYLNFF